MAKIFSTFAMARMLGVDPGSVANWIDQDLLVAHRTPGGHRRVGEHDLVHFLREHNMPIPSELDSSPKRVIVVDDDPGVAKLIVRTVKSAHPDYEVIHAHDGFRAGALVATLKPDVVILDIKMPQMDGYEVCQLIKSQPSTKHAEVLAITAYPSPESKKRILDCGARVCLNKPLDMDALLKEIEDSV